MTKKIDFSALDFSRVCVIGCPGSGKTTFSNNLGNLLGKQVVHLDSILWAENWQLRPEEQRLQIHDDVVSGQSWIVDGMWASYLQQRVQRSSLVIFLDYKRLLCFCRAFFRQVKYRGKQRSDLANGCIEKVDKEFLRYVWDFHKQSIPRVKDVLKQNANVCQVTFTTPRQAKVFLKQLAKYKKD